MKKTLAVILTVSLVLTGTTVALAKSGKPEKGTKSYTDVQKESVLKSSNPDKARGKGENKGIEKVKEELIKRCDDMIAQLQKLKNYIASSDGELLADFMDEATGNSIVKSIDDAILEINNKKGAVSAAASMEELRNLTRDPGKKWLKNQAIMKRITALTGSERLKLAYEKTKALLDRLDTGINSMTSDSGGFNIEALKKEYSEIQQRLEKARSKYIEAISMFVLINNENDSDKSFKDAHAKLMEAKKELNQCRIDTKKLLVKVELKARIENRVRERLQEAEEIGQNDETDEDSADEN